jgi:hypothetical protein
MKIKLVFVFLLIVSAVFSAPNVVLVSPYIVRGFSKTYAVSHHPEIINEYYEVYYYEGYKEKYGEYKNKEIKTVFWVEPERFNTVGIKNKAEICASLWGMPIGNVLLLSAICRFVLNVYDKGDYSLFKNIALSPFLGNLMSNHDLFGYWNGYIQNYCGISVGTKKQIAEKYSIELFVSPSYSITNYYTGFEFRSNEDMEVGSQNDFLVHSIDIPVGYRHIFENRAVKFSIKTGLGLHFNLKKVNLLNENYNYFDRGEVNSAYSFKSPPFSAFAEIGFHFGARRYNIERRKLLNHKSEVLYEN